MIVVDDPLYKQGYEDGVNNKPPAYPPSYNLKDHYWVGYDRGLHDRLTKLRREDQVKYLARSGQWNAPRR